MAEIKSTMDIIMERAEKLKVTEEDKRAFAEKEVTGRVRGLLQKYLDKSLSISRLKTEMASFPEDRKPMAENELLMECFRNMKVDSDLQPFLDVLERVLGRATGPVLDLVDEFQKEREKAHEERKMAFIQTLKERGVSGSAVAPNLRADSGWQKDLSHMNERFREKLGGIALK